MDNKERIAAIRERLEDDDWISPKTKIRRSKIGGSGLFAVKPIKKGELVIVWGGTYVNSKEAENARRRGKLVMQWDKNLFSIENPKEGSGYFVNHSCNPNLWMEGTYSLTAMRKIRKGEELTVDYAIWEADENYISKWDCKCGSEKCRGKVTGKDWKLPKLQKRHKDHFSPLINKKIKK